MRNKHSFCFIPVRRLFLLPLCALVVAGLAGCPVLPRAAFTAAPEQGDAPLAVTFQDASAPGASDIRARVWSFGFAAHSFERDPTQTFYLPGEYPVALAVVNNAGSDVATGHVAVAMPAAAKATPLARAAMPAVKSLDVLSTHDFPDGNFYPPGGTLLVEVQLDYAGDAPPDAVGQIEGVPEGWVFAGIEAGTTAEPTVTMDLSEDGRVEFFWLDAPTLPLTLRYRLAVPEEDGGPKVLYGMPLEKTTVGVASGEREERLVFSADDDCGSNDVVGAPAGDLHVELAPEGGEPVHTEDLTVEVTLGDEDAVYDGVSVIAEVPRGYTYLDVAGDEANLPPTVRDQPECRRVEFYWPGEMAMPFTFSYSLAMPEGARPYASSVSGVVLLDVDGTIHTTRFMDMFLVSDYVGDDPIPMQMTRAFPEEDMYTPGERFLVELTADYTGAGTLTALAMTDTVPRGWTYDGLAAGTTVQPAIAGSRPSEPETMNFMWIQIPAFPLSLQYYVIPALDSAGPQEFSGHVEYRESGGPLYSNRAEATAYPAGDGS
ncbi:MAG: PKD domain-containing protein [Candidatus Hydrogenedentota bacterium]